MQFHHLLARSIRIVLVTSLVSSAFLPVASAQTPPRSDPPAMRAIKRNPFGAIFVPTPDKAVAPVVPIEPDIHKTAMDKKKSITRTVKAPPTPPAVSLVGIVTSGETRQAVVAGARAGVVSDGDVLCGYRVAIHPDARSITLHKGTETFTVRLPSDSPHR